jgi:prepilin-type N-terminal cleavage/methylation domain-containing protein
MKNSKSKIQKTTERGFSLLELLMVITIIGVLTTVILNAISNARARSYDSKVKQQLTSFRTAAEVYFTNQSPNSYGPPSIRCDSGLFSDTNAVNGRPGIYIAAGNLPNNTQVVCGSSDSAFAVKATLYSGSRYWCVDNTGVSRLVSGPIGSPTTSCQ